MAVEVEQFESGSFVTGPWKVTPMNVRRHRSGGWAFLVRLIGEVTLPDGRIVEVSRRMPVRATGQVGRKPVAKSL